MDDLHRCPDRRQRIAQFVGQHRQELVLAAVGFPQRLFGLFTPCDIEIHANHAQGQAGSVLENLKTPHQPVDAAVGPGHSPFSLDRLSCFEGPLDQGATLGPVLGMDEVFPGRLASARSRPSASHRVPPFPASTDICQFGCSSQTCRCWPRPVPGGAASRFPAAPRCAPPRAARGCHSVRAVAPRPGGARSLRRAVPGWPGSTSRFLRCSSAKTATLERRIAGFTGLCR